MRIIQIDIKNRYDPSPIYMIIAGLKGTNIPLSYLLYFLLFLSLSLSLSIYIYIYKW